RCDCSLTRRFLRLIWQSKEQFRWSSRDDFTNKLMSFFRPLTPLLYGWLLSFIGWGLVAFVLGVNFVGGTDIQWTRALHAAIRDQLPWVLLTPLIFRFASRHLIDHATWKRNLLSRVLAAAVIIWT